MTQAHKRSNFACDKCPHVAVSIKRLRVHRSDAHDSGLKNGNFLCRHDLSEGGCEARFSGRNGLREHLAEQHGVAAAEEKIEIEFASKDEFESWKADYERRHAVFYRKKGAHGMSWQYVCSRSGVHTPSGSGRRCLKAQGSVKLGFQCTSALHVSWRNGGAFSAVLYTYHCGHSTGVANLPHVPLPVASRALARAQLLAGFSTQQIISNMQEQHADDGFAGPSRAARVNRKDVNNMRRCLRESAIDTNNPIGLDGQVGGGANMDCDGQAWDGFSIKLEDPLSNGRSHTEQAGITESTIPSSSQPSRSDGATDKQQLLAKLARLSALVASSPDDAAGRQDDVVLAKMGELHQLLQTATRRSAGVSGGRPPGGGKAGPVFAGARPGQEVSRARGQDRAQGARTVAVRAGGAAAR